jgi:AcrR family transcriptional regulator
LVDKKVDIYNSGCNLFCSKGFKDTNVSDIAKMAGIAVGTFYNYYSSKKKLFIQIYMKENEKLKKSIMESVDLDGDPIKVVKEVMTLNIIGMNSNPILKEWFNADVFRKLEKYYTEESGKYDANFLKNNFVDLNLIEHFEGKRRNDIDYDLMLAFFTSIMFIDTHKKEVGIHHFPKIIDYLVEFIMIGCLVGEN